MANVFSGLSHFGVEVQRDAALDFGCGVGRLSLPLASRFTRATGVDSSPTMIEHARRLAADTGTVNVDYRLGDPTRIDEDSGSQSFVLSLITLQHMPARDQARYVAEFARLLAPGGVAVFQVVTGHADAPTSPLRRGYRRVLPQRWRNAVRRSRRAGRGQPEMYCLPESVLMDAFPMDDVHVVADVRDNSAPGWDSRRFVLRRHLGSGQAGAAR